jgi:hypothetical protein
MSIKDKRKIKSADIQIPDSLHADIFAFPYAADRADPVIRDVFERGAGRYAGIGITLCGIVNVAADGAFVFGW